jgi:hypothetical protein
MVKSRSRTPFDDDSAVMRTEFMGFAGPLTRELD